MQTILAILAGFGIGAILMSLYRDRTESEDTTRVRDDLTQERIRSATLESRLLLAFDAGKTVPLPDIPVNEVVDEPLPPILLEFLCEYEDIDARMVWAKKLQRELALGKSPTAILKDIENQRSL